MILDVEDQLSFGSAALQPAIELAGSVGTWIFAENVVIPSGGLTSNNLNLVAYTLSADMGVTINASGVDGSSATPVPNGQAKNGTDGAAANNITLILESETPPINLMLLATGGDGGNGGQIKIYSRNKLWTWYCLLSNVFTATDNAIIIQATNDFIAAINTNLTLASSVYPQINITLTELKLLVALADSDSNVIAIRKLLLPLATSLYGTVTVWKDTVSANQSANGGWYGVHGSGDQGGQNGNNGESGNPGAVNVLPFYVLADLASLGAGFISAHPEQCEMLLQRAELLYLSAGISSQAQLNRNDAAILLKRLYQRTCGFSTLSPDSLLAQAYTDPHILAQLGTSNCIDALARVCQESSALLLQLQSGQDVFGFGYNYAPLASYAFYENLLGELINNFSAIEQAYNSYQQQLAEEKAATATLQSLIQQVNSSQNNIQQDINTLQSQLQSDVAMIVSLDAERQPKLYALNQALSRLENEIDSYISFNTQEFLAAIGQVVFAPESASMWVAQAGTLLYDFSSQITTDDGQTINKQYLIGQITSVAGTLQSLQEGYQTLQDGSVQEDDQGASILPAEQSALENSLSALYNSFPDSIQNVNDLLQDYIQCVMTRNAKILDYNACLQVLARKMASVAYFTEKKSTLSNVLTTTFDPTTPMLMRFVSRMYYQSRQQLMETLNLTARALNFWALQDNDPIADVLAQNSLPAITSTVLQGVQNQLLLEYANAVEGYGRTAQQYPNKPDEPGIMVELTQFQVGLLRSQNQVTLPPLLTATATSAAENNPFAGFANVRLTKVRLWVNGVVTQNNNLMVRITHNGNEKLVHPNDNTFIFDHKRTISTNFKYRLDDKSILLDGDALQVPDGGQLPYVLFGPFASWTLEIRAQNNLGLDLSGL